MEFSDLILKRRSVRDYKEGETIPAETIDEMLKAMQYAPTWKNFQTGRYYVVQSPEMFKMLNEGCLPSFNAQNTAKASAYIVTTFVKDKSGFDKEKNAENEIANEWGAYDLGLQNAYLLLKAAELGIDSLIMGIRDGAAIRELLSIPEEEEVMAVIALGYAASEPTFFPRKPLEVISKKF